jgi:hypothetical protein
MNIRARNLGWKIQKVGQYGKMCNLVTMYSCKNNHKLRMAIHCENDKIKLQMIENCI